MSQELEPKYTITEEPSLCDELRTKLPVYRDRLVDFVAKKTMVPRRKIALEVLNLISPVKVEDPYNNLSVIEEKLRNGEGIVGLFSHASTKDLTFPVGLGKESEVITNLEPVVFPAAWHQNRRQILQFLARFANIQNHGIVTKSTKEQEKKRQDEEKKIPWEIQPLGYGFLPYIKAAADALKKGGMVLYAPQTERQPYFYPFENRPISTFIELAQRYELPLEKLTFFLSGIKYGEDILKDIQNPNLQKKDKLYPGQPITVVIGEVIRADEFFKSIEDQVSLYTDPKNPNNKKPHRDQVRMLMDTYIWQQMNELLEPGYRVDKKKDQKEHQIFPA